VGETAVKASVAGRDCSMSALQKRLGAYCPPPETSVPKARAPETVSPDPGLWARYEAERRAHQDARQRARQHLADRTRSEWSTMVERQGQESGEHWRQTGRARELTSTP
jgi:hypothetical protein